MDTKKEKTTKELAEVWRDTWGYIKDDTPNFCPLLCDVAPPNFWSQKYQPKASKKELKDPVEIRNGDLLTVAQELKDQGLSTLVLCTVSKYHPGGGVRIGQMTQETEIFRRTTAALTALSNLQI